MTIQSAASGTIDNMPSHAHNVGPLLVELVSVTFEGTRLRITSPHALPGADELAVRIASEGSEVVARLRPEGEHFISHGRLSFTGFKDVWVDMTLSFGDERCDVGRLSIYRLPLVPFFRDAGKDHHDAFFFINCCGQYVAYGQRGVSGYPNRGVFLLSSGVDQNSILEMLETMDAACLEALQSRQALLYIDQSHEGNAFEASFAKALHRLLDEMRIDPDLVFFANHTFNWKDKYELWVTEAGVSVSINVIYSHWYADGLMFHERDYFSQFGGIDEFVRLQRFRAFSGFVRPKRFFSMNYTPRPHRVMLMLKLIESGYLKQGIVSFGGVGNSDKYKSNYYGMNGDGFIHAVGLSPLLDHLPTLEAMGALTVDRPFQAGLLGEAIRMSATMSQQPYDESYFSIVTESEMVFDSDFQRVTEKIYKPLLRLHPLIILGNANSFDLLEAEGFKTFDKIFDQSYDKHRLAAKRIEGAFAELDRLMSLSMEELAALYRRIWPALEHNIYHAHDYALLGLKRKKHGILDLLFKKLSELS